MIQIGNKDTNYGNWVPKAMMTSCSIAIAVLAVVTVILAVLQMAVFAAAVGALFVVVVVFTWYMKKCRDIFDFNKGGLMGKIHQYLLDHMEWD